MGFKHKNYEVFPAAQQLLNEDGLPGEWYGIAAVVRWRGNDGPLVLPVSWYPPTFATGREAEEYAAAAARDMIDSGRCKI